MQKKRIEIGALMRVYATDESAREGLAQNLINAIRQLRRASVNDFQIQVWSDPSFEAADYGGSYAYLSQILEQLPGVHVAEVSEGDLFVQALNQGLALQAARGLTHSFILSSEAHTYVDEDLVNAMRDQVDRGALVIGIALPDIAEFVCKGAVMNTAALWDIQELDGVNNFHVLDTRPKEKDFYQSGSNAGVGEFLPALTLFAIHDRPIYAVVTPKGGAIEVPEDRKELQQKKIAAKERRIDGMLKQVNRTRGDLEAIVMR